MSRICSFSVTVDVARNQIHFVACPFPEDYSTRIKNTDYVLPPKSEPRKARYEAANFQQTERELMKMGGWVSVVSSSSPEELPYEPWLFGVSTEANERKEV